ncbi:hypothetical protein V8F33_010440 [Rhypophila sp. PSN 637]
MKMFSYHRVDREVDREVEKYLVLSGFYEVCNGQNLESLMKFLDMEFQNKLKLNPEKPRQALRKLKRLAEPLIWHIINEVGKAIVKLHTGTPRSADEEEIAPLKEGERWSPIVHGAIKAENIHFHFDQEAIDTHKDKNNVEEARAKCFPRIVLGGFGNAEFRDKKQDREAVRVKWNEELIERKRIKAAKKKAAEEKAAKEKAAKEKAAKDKNPKDKNPKDNNPKDDNPDDEDANNEDFNIEPEGVNHQTWWDWYCFGEVIRQMLFFGDVWLLEQVGYARFPAIFNPALNPSVERYFAPERTRRVLRDANFKGWDESLVKVAFRFEWCMWSRINGREQLDPTKTNLGSILDRTFRRSFPRLRAIQQKVLPMAQQKVAHFQAMTYSQLKTATNEECCLLGVRPWHGEDTMLYRPEERSFKENPKLVDGLDLVKKDMADFPGPWSYAFVKYDPARIAFNSVVFPEPNLECGVLPFG